MTDPVGSQITEQINYYRKRAPEYDAWADRSSGFDRGHLNDGWHEEKRRLSAVLRAFGPRGTVLEIAGGTGQWTQQLLRYTSVLTVLDAADEALHENRKRTAKHTKVIEYHHADIFSWDPPERYDVVFFSYWLSHVPPERFDEFWERVARCLKPGGRVFLIDNLQSDEAEALDPEIPGTDDVSVMRPAPDGSMHRVWKVLWRPDELCKVLRDLGWDLVSAPTGGYFMWAAGSRTL